MKNSTEDQFIHLYNSGELDDEPTLLILELPKKSHLELANLPKLNNVDQIFVLVTTLGRNGNLEIKVGTRFDTVFPGKEIQGFAHCNVVLKYVNVNPRQEIDYLPGGYTGICLLEFEGGIPNEMIAKLAPFEVPKDPEKNDTLILTQNSVLNRLKVF